MGVLGGGFIGGGFVNAGSAGGGGVTSVNGNPGPAVVLAAVDVGADPAGTASAAVAAHVAALDPHPQYTTAAEAAAAAPVQSVNAQVGPVVLGAADVGADPSGTATAAVAAHVAAADPHPQYTNAAEAAAAAPVQSVNALTGAVVLNAASVGADPSGTATTAVANHVAAADPHPQYLTVAEVAALGLIDSGSGSFTVDEFLGSVVASTLGWTTSANGAGANVLANPAILAGANGYRAILIGTGGTGRCAYSFEQVINQAPYAQPWLTSTLTFDFRIHIPTLPTLAEDFEIGVSLGLGATTAGDVWTNGVGVRCSFGGTANVWTLASRTAGADVLGSVQPVVAAIAGWQWVRITVSPTGAAVRIGATKALMLAASPVSIAVGLLTTTTALGPMVKARRIAGSTARQLNFEYFAAPQTYTTPR